MEPSAYVPFAADSILFVCLDAANPNTLEVGKIGLFQSWGYTINLVSSTAEKPVFDYWLSKSGVVYLSQQIPLAHMVQSKLAPEMKGIVIENAAMAPGFGLSTSSGFVNNTSTLNIWDNGHFISLGLPAIPTLIFKPTEPNPATTFLLGKSSGGKVLAVNPNAGSSPALVVYETDSAIYWPPLNKAKGRRVVFGWGKPNLDVNELTFRAQTLMQKSIEWCKNSPPPARRNLQQKSSENGILDTLQTAILKSNFHGASGPVIFGKETKKGRNSDTISVGIFNIFPLPTNPETGKRSYTILLIGVKEGATSWTNIPNTTLIYRDGTTTPSRLLRRTENTNQITPSVRAIGLVLMSILIFVALATAALLFWLYNDPTVQSAQPIFMLLLCAGSVIMSTTIFTLSFDEAAGWTNHQLSVVCSLAPWFFFTGQLIICSAHFAKLYRLDQVLRWGLVTRSSPLWPWLLFVIVTVSILTAHTIYDPWSWVRMTITEIPFETYGECSSKHDLVFFGTLIGLIFVSELLTLVFAWKMADVPGDFRDAPAIMFSCFIQIQGKCHTFFVEMNCYHWH